MSGTRAISTTSRRELSSSFFSFPLQDKTPKEIHAILTETIACFHPGRAKNLPAPMRIYFFFLRFLILFNILQRLQVISYTVSPLQFLYTPLFSLFKHAKYQVSLFQLMAQIAVRTACQ